jgi:hypothetical protein
MFTKSLGVLFVRIRIKVKNFIEIYLAADKSLAGKLWRRLCFTKSTVWFGDLLPRAFGRIRAAYLVDDHKASGPI